MKQFKVETAKEEKFRSELPRIQSSNGCKVRNKMNLKKEKKMMKKKNSVI